MSSSIGHEKSRLLWSQARYKRDFDRRVRESNRHLTIGDYFYLDTPEKPKSKLGPITQGPYRVEKVWEHTIRINRDDVLERVNKDRVTAAPPPVRERTDTPITGGAQSPMETPVDTPTLEDEEPPQLEVQHAGASSEGEEYVVERILQHHVDTDAKGQAWYLIKWEGYPDPTWTEAENVPVELTSRFWKRLRRRERRARRATPSADTTPLEYDA